MKVGIIINNVLRDHITTLSSVYTRYTGLEPITPIDPYDLDVSFPLPEKDVVDVIIDEDSLSGVTVNDTEEIKSIQEFIHIDAPFEILGAADETETGIIQKLTTLQEDIHDEILLINRDSVKGRAATLFFLSKTNFGLNQVIFPDTYEGCWTDVDMLITDHPDIIACKPDNKKLIKLDREYITDYSSDFKIDNISEIITNKELYFNVKQTEENE